MTKEYYLGRGEIPPERQDYVIQILGQSFRDYFHALRQIIDNAKDSITKRREYDPSFTDDDRAILIFINKDERNIRVVDFGVGIVPLKPIWEDPTGKPIVIDGKKIPYVNSFENLQKSILDSIKRYEFYQTGEVGTGLLSFIKLRCKEVRLVSQDSKGCVHTYRITNKNKFYWREGGQKKINRQGVEVLLEGIDKRVFNNWFNEHRLPLYLQRTYHHDLLRKDIEIKVNYQAKHRVSGSGRQKKAPFIDIQPMEISGELFEITQIKTKTGKRIYLDLRITDSPREDSFILINCRGTGGVPAESVLYNPIWQNKHTQGFITADFLNFSGNDKSSFVEDDNLKEFVQALEEKVEEDLAKKITSIKRRRAEEKIEKILDNLKYALYRTLKKHNINLEGIVDRTKKCPQCEKILPYNQQKCPECGYEFPRHIKNCRFCNKEVPLAAKICPHCGKDLIEKMNCPKCGEEIPKLSFVCPSCGERLRPEREPPKGKSPDLALQHLGVYESRSAIDKEDGVLKVIKINIDHTDFERASNNDYEELYIATLVSKEVAKYQFGEENIDFSDDMITIFLGMFDELRGIASISYKETGESRVRRLAIT